MTPAEQQIMNVFQEALTDRLVADFYRQSDPRLNARLARARAAAQRIGDETAYQQAVTNAHCELTACMTAAWVNRRRA